jgi:dihydrofolate reductase
LVLTRNADYVATGASVFTDLYSMIGQGYELAGAAGVDEVMLIGGAQLYETLLPRCDRLYVTRVDAEVEGDAMFPEINPNIWKLTHEDGTKKGPKDEFSFDVAVYDRVS